MSLRISEFLLVLEATRGQYSPTAEKWLFFLFTLVAFGLGDASASVTRVLRFLGLLLGLYAAQYENQISVKSIGTLMMVFRQLRLSVLACVRSFLSPTYLYILHINFFKCVKHPG